MSKLIVSSQPGGRFDTTDIKSLLKQTADIDGTKEE